MDTKDYLLLNHIACTTEGLGSTRRRSSAPSIILSIAIMALAAAILIVGLR